MSHRVPHTARALLTMAVMVSACNATSGTPLPASTPAAAATSELSRGVSEEQIAWWTRFRHVYELPSDRGWIVEVASDPTASAVQFGVPLLPAERARVGEANASAQSLIPFAHRYAAAVPEFAGLWLELPFLVMGFTAGVPQHQAELERLFGHEVIVRGTRYTLRELREFAQRIRADNAWFTAIEVEVIDASLDEMANGINLYYRAPTENLEALIRQRYEDPDWLTLDWAGPPHWTGPYGDLELRVVDRAGNPVEATFVLRPLDPRVSAFGPGGLEDGNFVNIGIAAVDWAIELTYVRDGQGRTITRGFTVPADDVVKVTVVIPE